VRAQVAHLWLHACRLASTCASVLHEDGWEPSYACYAWGGYRMNRGGVVLSVGLASLAAVVAVAIALVASGMQITGLDARVNDGLKVKADQVALASESQKLTQAINDKPDKALGLFTEINAQNMSADSANMGSVNATDILTVASATSTDAMFTVDPTTNGATLSGVLSAGGVDSLGGITGGSFANAGGTFRAGTNGAIQANGGVFNSNVEVRSGSWKFLFSGSGLEVQGPNGLPLQFGIKKDTGQVVMKVGTIALNQAVELVAGQGFGLESARVTKTFSVGTQRVSSDPTTYVQRFLVAGDTGNVDTSGTLTADGGLSTRSDATVGGTVTAGNAMVVGDLGVNGKTSLFDLWASAAKIVKLEAGSAEVTGALNVDGDLWARSAKLVGLEAGSAVVTGTLDVLNGKTSLSDLAAGSANVTGALTATTADVSSHLGAASVDVTGTLKVAGTTTLAGLLDAKDITASKVTASNLEVGQFTVAGDTGNVDTSGTVTVAGDIIVKGSVFADFNNTNTKMVSANVLEAKTRLETDLIQSRVSANPASIALTNDFVVDAANFNVDGSGNLAVVGNVTGGNFISTGDVRVGGNLKDTNNKFSGTVTVDGSSQSKDLSFSPSSVIVAPSDETTSAWWVTTSGSAFTVHMDPAPSSPVKFFYMAIE
jgi:hypothetical protein